MKPLLLATLIAASPSSAVEPGHGAAVEKIRAAWSATEASVASGVLSSSTIVLGGGQNPSEVLVHYQGGSEADFEADPYAEPFTVLRVEQRKVLPAVGPASATFWFDPSGELYFAYAVGTDISGVTTLPLTPLDEVRAYFDGGAPVLLLHDDATSQPARHSYALQGAQATEHPEAIQAAQALQARGVALRQSLETLAGGS